MVDPLAEVVTLLQPGARLSKLIHGASPWRIRRSDAGQPFYCVVLEGGCRITIDGHAPLELQAGDFALVPAAHGIAVSSLREPPRGHDTLAPQPLGHGEFRLGPAGAAVDLRMVAGAKPDMKPPGHRVLAVNWPDPPVVPSDHVGARIAGLDVEHAQDGSVEAL